MVKWRLGFLITSGLIALLVAIVPAPHIQHGLLLVLLLVLPTLAWAGRLDGGLGSRLLLAFGWVLVLDTAVALVLHALPGALPAWQIVLTLVGLTVLPLLPVGTWQLNETPVHWRGLWPWLILIFLASLMRVPNLAYKELQGDEGIILTRAASVLVGDDAELYLHQKGPVEILIPLLTWGSVGQMTEFWGRVTFTLASVMVVVGLAYLGQFWFGPLTGWLTGMIFVVNGFSVAFARIIQYQSFVMLWGILAVVAAAKHARDGRFQSLFLAGMFLGAGLLAHYDAILFAPAVGLLLLSRVREYRYGYGRDWLISVVSALALVAAFYVPFVLSPSFARTGSYLINDRIGVGSGSALFNGNFLVVWQMMTFYNSTYYIVGLTFLVMIGFLSFRYLYREKPQSVLAALLLLAAPLVVYTLIVADPRTHIYTFFPGMTILAAVGAERLVARIPRRGGLTLLMGILGLWWLVSGTYILLMFIDDHPERQRTWVENRPPFFPVTWNEPPQYGLFGFPYQAGWRVVGELSGEFNLPYASNEEPEITNYYMRQALRSFCPEIETFIWAEHVQDELPYDKDMLVGMDIIARVSVGERTPMVIYGRTETQSPELLTADNVTVWRTPAEVAPPLPLPQYPVDLVLGDAVRLLGYSLNETAVSPGDTLLVTLYWESLAPFDQNYQVFTHLYDGEMRGQHDGAPQCDFMPTTRWEPGQIIIDTHPIAITPDTPVGKVPLLVGMYNLITTQRLTVNDSNADSIFLTDIQIVK